MNGLLCGLRHSITVTPLEWAINVREYTLYGDGVLRPTLRRLCGSCKLGCLIGNMA